MNPLSEEETKLSNVQHKLFQPESGTQEAHAVLQAPSGLGLLAAWQYLQASLTDLEEAWGFTSENRLFTRIFFSDITNQLPLLRKHFPQSFPTALSPHLSCLQQPPLPASKLAVWMYWVKGEGTVTQTAFGNEYTANGMRHLWTANVHHPEKTTEGQTAGMFQAYRELLQHHGGNLLDNALRTWVFVRDIDTHYGAVVEARKHLFTQHGLTPKTHYISSTGIEGITIEPKQATCMDAYSLFSIDPKQVQFLKAPEHLCPTHHYGVTFERGTAIHYGDRKHILLSGTASIDKRGDVVHPNDVERQTERAVENLAALLENAQAQLSDLMHAIIYVRDASDELPVREVVDALLPSIPYLILQAPVCRPAWLIEIEGMAIVPAQSKAWPVF